MNPDPKMSSFLQEGQGPWRRAQGWGGTVYTVRVGVSGFLSQTANRVAEHPSLITLKSAPPPR